MGVKVVPVAIDRPAEVYTEGASWKIEEERQGLHYVKIFDDKAQLLGQHLAQYVYSISKVQDNNKAGELRPKAKSKNGNQIRTHPDNGGNLGRHDTPGVTA